MNPLSWSEYVAMGLPEGYISFLRDDDNVEILKKRKGWDDKTMWLKISRKDDIFQWVHAHPQKVLDLLNQGSCREAAQVVKEEDLLWNFIVREPPEGWSEKVDLKFFSGPFFNLTFQQHVSWNGDEILYGNTDEYFSDHREFTGEFYSNAYPMIELPDLTLSPEPVEGWTHLEDSEEDREVQEEDEQGSEENDEEDNSLLLEVSIQALLDENKRLKEENKSLKEEETILREKMEAISREKMKEYFNNWKENVSDYDDEEDDSNDYDAYAEEIYQERRIDPFDKEMYTKEEFQEYYGYDGFGDEMWDMNHPEKISKVLMYEWVLSRNKDVLNTKNKNYIIDKMISVMM